MNRCQFLAANLRGLTGVVPGLWVYDLHVDKRATGSQNTNAMNHTNPHSDKGTANIVLFFCGDVMTGRGIDQILAYPSKPIRYESYMTSVMGYVELVERCEWSHTQAGGPRLHPGECLGLGPCPSQAPMLVS